MFCRECGQKLQPGDVFCPACGTPVEEEDPGVKNMVPPRKTKHSDETPLAVYIALGVVMAVLVVGIVWAGFQLTKSGKKEEELSSVATADSADTDADKIQMEANESTQEATSVATVTATPVATATPTAIPTTPVATATPVATVTPAATATPVPTTLPSGDYVLSNSSSSYLSTSEVEALSGYDMYLARNEILARHGYIFVGEDLKEYFGSKSWYTPRYTREQFDYTWLSDIETANIELIKEIEAKYGYKYGVQY